MEGSNHNIPSNCKNPSNYNIPSNNNSISMNINDFDNDKEDDQVIERLIVLDYDDTLICSTYISKQLSSSSTTFIPSNTSSSAFSSISTVLDCDNKENLQISATLDNDNTYNDDVHSNDDGDYDYDSDYERSFNDDEQWSHMSVLENESINLLTEASKHGHVIIISNAEGSWIDFTLKQYFPLLLETLNNLKIEIVSARDKFYHLNNNPLMWKMYGFRQEISAFIHRYSICHQQRIPKNLRFSVMSIGDGMHEKMACQSICENELKKEHVTIKLFESPTPFVLQKQLSKITENFSLLLSESLQYTTTTEMLGRHLALSSMQNGDIFIKECNCEDSHHNHHHKSKRLEISTIECKEDDDSNNSTMPVNDKGVIQETCCSYNYWNCFK